MSLTKKITINILDTNVKNNVLDKKLINNVLDRDGNAQDKDDKQFSSYIDEDKFSIQRDDE